jgi:cbb3-type cytochrome oxidase subunit 3
LQRRSISRQLQFLLGNQYKCNQAFLSALAFRKVNQAQQDYASDFAFQARKGEFSLFFSADVCIIFRKKIKHFDEKGI